MRSVELPTASASRIRKVDVRLPGKKHSNSLGVRPVRQIIMLTEWSRTSKSSTKNFSLCIPNVGYQVGVPPNSPRRDPGSGVYGVGRIPHHSEIVAPRGRAQRVVRRVDALPPPSFRARRPLLKQDEKFVLCTNSKTLRIRPV